MVSIATKQAAANNAMWLAELAPGWLLSWFNNNFKNDLSVHAEMHNLEMCPKHASKAIPGSSRQSLDCGKANARYGVDN